MTAAKDWVRHDGGAEEWLPVLFAAALTQTLAETGALNGGKADELRISADERVVEDE